MSTGPSHLESILAGILGGLGNFSLSLDPLSRARLSVLEGTRVRVNILPPGSGDGATMTILVTGGQLVFLAGERDDPHLVLTGTPPDIIRLLLGRGGDGSVRIEGDEALLEKLAGLFRQLEADPAAPLAKLLGRDLADDLAGMLESGAALFRSAAQSMAGGFRAEARNRFVDQQDFRNLLDRIHELRLRLDRLHARSERLAGASTDIRSASGAPASLNAEES